MAESYQIDDVGGYDDVRPIFYIGQHDSTRSRTLDESEYGQVLNAGFSFVTTPITNGHFHDRVLKLLRDSSPSSSGQDSAASRADPSVPPLTIDDTTLFPGNYTSGLVAYSSAWIDLCSLDPTVSSISRQVLNLEVAYANFCGVRSIIVPGPRHDAVQLGSSQGIAQYARAIQEALVVGTRIQLIVHLPMYREPGLEEKIAQLSLSGPSQQDQPDQQEIDLFGAWDSWHVIRTACDYDPRLFVALKIPRRLPEKELQTRWFSEPLMYLTFGPETFQTNKTGHPSLSRYHQEMIHSYMRLKNAPYFLLCDVGPVLQEGPGDLTDSENFPALGEGAPSHDASQGNTSGHTSSEVAAAKRDQNTSDTRTGPASTAIQGHDAYASYLRHVERQQEPLSVLEQGTLTNFQDWLQSPLQPLSDNLESITYEVFEGDPVKYVQYERAIAEALREWARQGKPTSSPEGVVVAVAGSGRGPLVTRALRASEQTGVPVKVWAVEKNPNAYVYLQRQNRDAWGGRVTVVKTDMRAWQGPSSSPVTTSAAADPGGGGGGPPVAVGKVDILVSELLGSFGDNELSPECLDGIQHVLAPGHGISIPRSYTAHLSPVASPRLFADISQRHATAPSPSSSLASLSGGGSVDAHAFDTPWVVRLFAVDFVAQRGVPDRPRFQRAWEFAHPLPPAVAAAVEARRRQGSGGGGDGSVGSMAGAGTGANDHNARHCCLTFVCRQRGVVHGLAGYFEAVLYRPSEAAEESGGGEGQTVELSTLPGNIDRKSKDMISWFPIFFPLKHPLYVPPDSELEVSMWRQTDDAKVWYEWMVEAYMWTGPSQRVKVGGSDMCSSRKVACLM
ncbi:PRMT5 arginine-N-methyltransferase-domain-containing protein [Xylariaceae sp. FL0804]|nr:PRMT5 arginine-N-methyltransferase-domain-containing protein [Xylariaceae sp. FL0804]